RSGISSSPKLGCVGCRCPSRPGCGVPAPPGCTVRFVVTRREDPMIKVLVVLGTRPEAIKLAPVIRGLQQHGRFSVTVCATSQHREMLDQALQVFGIRSDWDLGLMKAGQDLIHIT